MTSTYDSRIAAQLEQFKEGISHDLPAAFQYWSLNCISPRLIRVFRTNVIADIFAQLLTDGGAMPHGSLKFASLGAGDVQQEVTVAKSLRKMGYNSFLIDCYELSQTLLAKGQALVESEGLRDNFRFIQRDLNEEQLNDDYDGVMAHHSLHHLVGLEAIFDSVRARLKPGGTFAVYDIIGRNGHMRWPEVRDIVKHIWASLDESKKRHHQLNQTWKEFIDFDCSFSGFEGIRAQDILPALLSRFHFSHFCVFGGLTEVFVDRAFGKNYDPTSESDKGFIDFIEHLNNLLIDCGHIKPTIMFAGMRSEASVELKCERHWTPKFCVRPPDLADQ